MSLWTVYENYQSLTPLSADSLRVFPLSVRYQRLTPLSAYSLRVFPLSVCYQRPTPLSAEYQIFRLSVTYSIISRLSETYLIILRLSKTFPNFCRKNNCTRLGAYQLTPSYFKDCQLCIYLCIQNINWLQIPSVLIWKQLGRCFPLLLYLETIWYLSSFSFLTEGFPSRILIGTFTAGQGPGNFVCDRQHPSCIMYVSFLTWEEIVTHI